MIGQSNSSPYRRLTQGTDNNAHLPTSSAQLGTQWRLHFPNPMQLLRQGVQLIFPKKPPQPLWVEKGWQKGSDGRHYTGNYEAYNQTWRGTIHQPYPGRFEAFIWNPPITELTRYTTHGACFSPKGEGGRYQIHFHTLPSSLDHAISKIEEVLSQAMRKKRR